MRWLIPAVVLFAGCPEKQPVPPKPPNTDLIAGVYERHKPDGETAIRFESNGSYRIAKNREQFDVEPAVGTGTYKIDAATNPKALDLTHTSGPDKGQTVLGIYTLTGDSLKICFGDPAGKQRPTEFAARPNTQHLLVVLKRDKS